MSISWRRVDHFGNWLEIDGERCDGHLDDPCVVVDDYHLHASVLPEFVAALYAAVALPAPVILERPAPTFKDGLNRAGSIEVDRLRDRVTVGLYGIQPEEIEPGEARRLAALIAIRADEVQAGEPDSAEVLALALVLSDGLSPTDEDRVNARTVLRAGYKREVKP